MGSRTDRLGSGLRLSVATFSFALALVAALGCSSPGERFFLEDHDLEVPVETLAPAAAPAPRAGDRETARALVDLKTQVDLRRLGRMLSERGLPKQQRRRIVLDALATVAERSRRELVSHLESLQRRGLIREFRAYSVVNRIRVVGAGSEILALAGHPSVASIQWESLSRSPVWAASDGDPPGAGAAESRTSWALAAIGADEAHRRGLVGRGVVVAIIDSGASATHEQLRAGFRGAPEGWHDPVGSRPAPTDGAFGHGSGVLSTAVGANANGIRLGVAPGAGWAGCAALPDGHYNNALLTECADWMIHVARPDVLINAWLLPAAGCDPSLRRIVDAWRATEILPVFAVGNHGPDPGGDRSPANYVDLYPGGAPALSVGGVGRGGELLPLSTPGPNSCAPDAPFPALTAPAEDLIAALPLTTSSYRQVSGTSFAAGLVAGAAAILLQAHPDSSVAELERALLEGAADLGPPGRDAAYGHGHLDIPGSLEVLAEIDARRRPRAAAAAVQERRRREAAASPAATSRQAQPNQSPARLNAVPGEPASTGRSRTAPASR